MCGAVEMLRGVIGDIADMAAEAVGGQAYESNPGWSQQRITHE